MLRIPHCLDSRLIDGGKIVTLRIGRTLLHRNIYFVNVFGTGLVRPEGLGKFKMSPHPVSKPRPSLATAGKGKGKFVPLLQ
jgi:hypothetical protein